MSKLTKNLQQIGDERAKLKSAVKFLLDKVEKAESLPEDSEAHAILNDCREVTNSWLKNGYPHESEVSVNLSKWRARLENLV